MEDYRIDIMIDKGPGARSVQLTLAPFTLIGATTRSGLLTSPLRARFGINCHLEYYSHEVLEGIVKRSARLLQVPITDDAAREIALRSRGTPRIANSLLRRVRDFAQVKGSGKIDTAIARYALEALMVLIIAPIRVKKKIKLKDGKLKLEAVDNQEEKTKEPATETAPTEAPSSEA